MRTCRDWPIRLAARVINSTEMSKSRTACGWDSLGEVDPEGARSELNGPSGRRRV
jgi:hypothetical protein